MKMIHTIVLCRPCLARLASCVFGAIVDRTVPTSAAVSGNSAASSIATADPWANFSY
jgi:hypothetical protein